MAAKVETANEISLGGVYYPLARPIQSVLASIYPSKVVIGDTTRDSQVRTSVIAWSDWRGGIGVDRMESGGDVNRAWWSTCQLRYKNHLVLGNLANQTDTIGHGLAKTGGGTGIAAINEHDDKIYAVWNDAVGNNSKIYVYNNASEYWWDGRSEDAVIGANGSDTGLEGIEIQVTDSLNYTDNLNVTWLILAHYDSTGSTWSFARYPSADPASSINAAWDKPDTDKATKYLTSWDNRLWGISHGGQLWYAHTISDDDGTAVDDALLPLPAGYVTGMFVARDASGEPVIYVSTKKGLWAHDAANARFVKTEVEFPFHPHAGKGADRWRDSIYFPSGLGLYRYVNGTNAPVLTVSGPDRDDGLPESNRGTIMLTAGTHNDLLVGVDATTAPNITDSDSIPYQWSAQAVTGISGLGAQVIDSGTGYSSILGYNEVGWEVKWVANTAGRRIDAMHVSNAYSNVNENYRLWFGFNDYVYFMKLPVDIINPSRVTEFEYQSSGIHETPWFNAGQSEVDKLALKLKTEVQDVSSTETVTVSYATDYSESYTPVPVINTASLEASGYSSGATSGIDTYVFGSSAGTAFRAIKFKIELERTTTTTTANYKKKTPDVVSLTLEWRKKLEAKWGHQVQIDLSNEYKGNTSKELRSALLSAIESTTLVEFTFRDDAGGTRNFYVDVNSATGLEYSGYDERGVSTLNLVEP